MAHRYLDKISNFDWETFQFSFWTETLTIYLILDRSSNSEPDVKILIFYWSSSTLLYDVALTKQIVAKFHKTCRYCIGTRAAEWWYKESDTNLDICDLWQAANTGGVQMRAVAPYRDTAPTREGDSSAVIRG